ncbi:Uncharacterised protein [BD1-7 clade bacterium]|uniref:Uncharacterized protein n=1 Tax=BD1-7 clade bacterium TaxID=2029982 RepID=A0A5S9QR88_9GAMM|nr:Uncharacterised protein [BD1-7 clade bacterium]CAA0121818.1 Uncharacterised protein [BD1-7 clade bacterium]
MKNFVRSLGIASVALLAACENDNGSLQEPLFNNYSAYKTQIKQKPANEGDVVPVDYSGYWLLVQDKTTARTDIDNNYATSIIKQRSISRIEQVEQPDGISRLSVHTCGDPNPDVVDVVNKSGVANVNHGVDDELTTIVGTTKWQFSGNNRLQREAQIEYGFLADRSTEKSTTRAIKIAPLTPETRVENMETVELSGGDILQVISGVVEVDESPLYQSRVTAAETYSVSCFDYVIETNAGRSNNFPVKDGSSTIYMEARKADESDTQIQVRMTRVKDGTATTNVELANGDGSFDNFEHVQSNEILTTSNPARLTSLFFRSQTYMGGLFDRGELDTSKTPAAYEYIPILKVDAKL